MAKANTLVSGTNKHHASLGNYYFDALKNSESSAPSGGPEFGEKLKDYAEENIKVTHDLIRHEAVPQFRTSSSIRSSRLWLPPKV